MRNVVQAAMICFSLLGVKAALAAEDSLCSTEYLDISPNGKSVALNKGGDEQFTMEKSAKGYGFKAKGFSKESARQFFNQNMLDRVEVDSEGKARKLFLKEKLMGSAEPVYTVYELDYKNGRCFVKNKVQDKEMKAISQLCRSLADALTENQQCNEQTEKKIRDLMMKYKMPSIDQAAPKKSYGPVADAGRVIGVCEDDSYLKRSFSDQSLWAGSANQTPAAAK